MHKLTHKGRKIEDFPILLEFTKSMWVSPKRLTKKSMKPKKSQICEICGKGFNTIKALMNHNKYATHVKALMNHYKYAPHTKYQNSLQISNSTNENAHHTTINSTGSIDSILTNENAGIKKKPETDSVDPMNLILNSDSSDSNEEKTEISNNNPQNLKEIDPSKFSTNLLQTNRLQNNQLQRSVETVLLWPVLISIR